MARKKFFLKKLKIQEIAENFQKHPFQGGSHLRSALPSTSSALLISMSALQKSNVSIVNQNDMLIKQKIQVFIVNFF